MMLVLTIHAILYDKYKSYQKLSYYDYVKVGQFMNLFTSSKGTVKGLCELISHYYTDKGKVIDKPDPYDVECADRIARLMRAAKQKAPHLKDVSKSGYWFKPMIRYQDEEHFSNAGTFNDEGYKQRYLFLNFMLDIHKQAARVSYFGWLKNKHHSISKVYKDQFNT